MHRLSTILVPVALLGSSLAQADCRDVIELAKLRTEVVQDSSSLDQLARNFCSEYASAKANNKSMNVGLSYASLGLSFGQGSASAEQIASKYCDSTDSSRARSDAYRQYVESIAPGAFAAYERCEALRGSGISISVDKNSVLPRFLVATVSFQSNDSMATQIIDFAASPDLQCAWKNGEKTGTKTTLPANTSDSLACQRKSDAIKSAIHIFPKSKPNSQVSFPWDAYQAGVPVDLLKILTLRVESSTTTLNETTESLRSSVLAFAAAACPSGWEEYTPAYGRFVRGIDKAGSADPSGQRMPGSLQDDEFKGHEHTRPRDVYDAGSHGIGSYNQGSDYGIGFTGAPGREPTGPNTGVTGGPETRPRNVALLYCRRK